MNISRKNAAFAVGGAVTLAIGLFVGGCGLGKATEPFNDAHVTGHINNGAAVANMPDGFSNWSEKCDGHGFRVFVVFHGDNGYGAITAVPDPACKTAP